MTTPPQTPPEAPPAPNTSVILVVKGAGLQKPDETLSVFLNGFWPAIKSIDPTATLRQRADVFPDKYLSSPHDKEPHNHVTEILTASRRIWIKESYWEHDLAAASALTGLQREWHMASYAYGSVIYELLFGLDSRRRNRSAWAYYQTYVLTYWLLLLLPLWLLITKLVPPSSTCGLQTACLQLAGGVAGIALLVSLFAAWPLALETRRLMAGGQFTRLPAIAGWVLAFLAASFVLNPLGYLGVLFKLALAQLALLWARARLWPHRKIANSDSDSDDYYCQTDADGGRHFGRRDMPAARISQVFYRYIVAVALPITFPSLILARLLKWTRVLNTLGDAVETTIDLVLGSVLGDVATYAMDPAQAHQVRCAVETDLGFFHNHLDVLDLHVFAHSQGTPITFEVLFNHLTQAHRAKIKTYVTIGSVLSYYHQANPVLDARYVGRFPVRPYPEFHPDFKWMNFWNLADPITEFYGLDEYNMVVKAPDCDDKVERHPCSPTNIKTRFTLQNHSEYWSNLDQVQIPFAKRVLGTLKPPEWTPDKLEPISQWAYQFWLSVLWLVGVVVMIGILWLAVWLWQQPWTGGLQAFLPAGWEVAKEVIKGLLPDQSPLFDKVLDWLKSPSAVQVYLTAIRVTLLGAAGLFVLKWVWGLVNEVRKRTPDK